MRSFIKLFFNSLLFIFFLFPFTSFADNKVNIPILCYHNLNPTVPGSMTITPQKFEMQVKWLKDNGYNIIPLKEAAEYLLGKRASIPPKSVVITADDGWQSVYTYMKPIVLKYHIPVTLFIYPATISVGKNALTWDELKELQQTGLFEVEGHTYWHPNFKQEQKHRSATDYDQFVKNQLENSKKKLEEKLGTPISFLAWPFGIYNPYLEQAANKAGYLMSFSIDDETADRNHRAMAQPRFMIIEGRSMKTFENIVKRANQT